MYLSKPVRVTSWGFSDGPGPLTETKGNVRPISRSQIIPLEDPPVYPPPCLPTTPLLLFRDREK